MLDYVKDKPRWRPSRGKSNDDPEDVLAFKQIYLSKAAETYRKNLAKKVDDIFYKRITAMREEDAAREALMLIGNASPRDPFHYIFEQNNVSEDDIPGFLSNATSFPGQTNNAASQAGGGGRAAGAGGGDANRNSASQKTLAGSGGKRGSAAGLSNPLQMMKHETPSVDVIKERINLRRSMNPAIAMKDQELAALEEEDSEEDDGDTQDAPSVGQFSLKRPPAQQINLGQLLIVTSLRVTEDF